MNYKNIKRLLLLFFMVVTIMFSLCTKTDASDYQYKVLDPQYNPQAQALIDGKYNDLSEATVRTHKSFDFGTFIAIFVLITFPILVVKLAFNTFRSVTASVVNTKENLVKELPAMPKEPVKDSVQDFVNEPIAPPVARNIVEKRINAVQAASKSSSACVTSPIVKKQNPMLLNTSALSSNKGLCVVEYNKKYSLIGYINDEIFLLDQFDNLKNTEIRSRLTETCADCDKYIVKLGEYKALVEVNEKDMKLLLEL